MKAPKHTSDVGRRRIAGSQHTNEKSRAPKVGGFRLVAVSATPRGGGRSSPRLFHCCLRGREPSDRHPVGRARHVVEADPLAELDRRGIATVLAANAELDVGPCLAAAIHGDRDELPDPVDIDRDEGIDIEDALMLVVREEIRRIVAADTERGLRQVVRPEAEELRPSRRARAPAGQPVGARSSYPPGSRRVRRPPRTPHRRSRQCAASKYRVRAASRPTGS